MRIQTALGRALALTLVIVLIPTGIVVGFILAVYILMNERSFTQEIGPVFGLLASLAAVVVGVKIKAGLESSKATENNKVCTSNDIDVDALDSGTDENTSSQEAMDIPATPVSTKIVDVNSESMATTDCPYCGEVILQKAKLCKHCKSNLNDQDKKVSERPIEDLPPRKDREAVSDNGWGSYGFALAVGLAVFFYFSGSNSQSGLGHFKSALAIGNARSIVKDQLKSPSSYSERSSKVLWSGVNSDGLKSYIIKLEYDAQNGFGAMLAACQWVSFSENEENLTWNRIHGVQSCPGAFLSDERFVELIKTNAFGIPESAVATSE